MKVSYKQRFEKIEAVLDTWLPKQPDSEWMLRMFGPQGPPFGPKLAFPLVQGSRDLMERGGKRWRPLLLMLAAEAIGGKSAGEEALPLTPLVELPHTGSLIHDDIEDNSDERRGKPAVHILYGTDTALNAGSFLYFLPLACLTEWAKNKSAVCAIENKIWAVWALQMRALHLGQAMDINWHRDHSYIPGLDEYDRMCRFKTGGLSRLAAVLGVYSGAFSFAGKQGEEIDAASDVFGEAAEKLGVGFQILDDVKNLDTGNPGKKRGDDIVEGKKSLPVLLFLHRYPEKKDFAARCFTAAGAAGINAPEVEEIIASLKETGVLEEARQKGLEYIRQSREVFGAPSAAGFPLDEEGRTLLAGIADLLL